MQVAPSRPSAIESMTDSAGRFGAARCGVGPSFFAFGEMLSIQEGRDKARYVAPVDRAVSVYF